MKLSIKRFIDCHVPTEVCNFRCPYCYIGQKRSLCGQANKVGRKPEEVRAALSMQRWGGVLFINFCAGGETLLLEDILPIIRAVLEEGHIVQIVTNGSVSERFDEIAEFPKKLLDRLFVKFSFHYTELKRLNLVERFFDNILKVKNAGASISLEITPGDEMVPYIDEIKKVSIEKLGALPHVTVARNENTLGFEKLTSYTDEKYEKIWGQFESPMFDLKMRLLSEKREEFCYGGEWTFFLHLGTGDLKQCYRGAVIDNIFRNTDEPIHFRPIGKHCPESYCYNGHAWLTLGAIPKMDIPTYCEIRDRECKDGTYWLSDTMREAFSQKLEKEHTIYDGDCSQPKVVLLGDSICNGYTKYVQKNLEGKVKIYHPTDVGRFTTYFLRYIAEWAHNLRIGSDIDIVHFNVGLWDILRIYGDEPLVSLEQYTDNLKRIYKRLRYVFPNAKLIFALTTPICEDASDYSLLRINADVSAYNKAAKIVFEKCGVDINDLHAIAMELLQEHYQDMVHFTEEGYERLGRHVSEVIQSYVEE